MKLIVSLSGKLRVMESIYNRLALSDVIGEKLPGKELGYDG